MSGISFEQEEFWRAIRDKHKSSKGNMIPKYHIEYAIELGGHREPHVRDFQTDDPVACEEFLVAALEGGIKIKAIRHEGVDLTQREFDVLVKNAANTLAAKHVAKSLGLNAEQVHYRFGLAA